MLENLLNIDGFITVNKKLCREIGLNASALIGVLYSEYNYWKAQNKLTKDGFFFCTREKIEYNTGLTPHEQRTAIKKLTELNILETKLDGMPATTHYKINEDSLLSILTDVKKFDNKLLKNLTTSSEKISQQVVKKMHLSNNINNKNINENIDNNIKCVQGTKFISKKLSKKERILKLIEKKFTEYDFKNESVLDKIIEFYTILIDNNKLVSEQKINADLGNLAKVNSDLQIKTLDMALQRGWQSLNPEWVNNSTNTGYQKNTLIHHEQKIADDMGNHNF